MSDSAYYEGSTPSQSDASVNQQIFSSGVPPSPQLLQQQTAAMQSTNIITCRLCQNIFCEPVIFSCGHTFCLACSEKWRKMQRLCPQDGCGKPLGETVPNLLVKEASISPHARMKANQQQALTLQLQRQLFMLQQQLFGLTIGSANHLPPMRSCEANNFYDIEIELRERQSQQWIGAGEVGGRKSLIDPSTPRSVPNRAFVRGALGRRTETHQMPSQPAFSKRRSLVAMFLGRPKEVVPGRSTEDFALGKRRTEEKWDNVWMGDESRESSDLASHQMNMFQQAKKDKSLWSKTKYIFSSNKAKK